MTPNTQKTLAVMVAVAAVVLAYTIIEDPEGRTTITAMATGLVGAVLVRRPGD